MHFCSGWRAGRSSSLPLHFGSGVVSISRTERFRAGHPRAVAMLRIESKPSSSTVNSVILAVLFKRRWNVKSKFYDQGQMRELYVHFFERSSDNAPPRPSPSEPVLPRLLASRRSCGLAGKKQVGETPGLIDDPARTRSEPRVASS